MRLLTVHWLGGPFRELWSLTWSMLSPKSVEQFNERKDDSEKLGETPLVSTFRKWCNFIGCIFATILYYYMTIYSSNYLHTLDTLLTLYLAEYCGWANEKVRRKGLGYERAANGAPPDLSLAEKGEFLAPSKKTSKRRVESIAAVVGYREDPDIFTKSMESYLDADCCRFVLTSVDGNSPEDQPMVDIFQKVFPTNSAILKLQVPFIDIAQQMVQDSPPGTSETVIIDKCVALAKKTLLENDIHITGLDSISRLCVTQPHMHKKGIMFTSFIICFAISEILGIDFVWTSDSDSMVFKDTIRITMETIDGNEKCGGASTALSIHNSKESLVTTLSSTVYLNDMHLSRCFSSAMGANDCQSGPCAAFRISAIRPEILAWYGQQVFGHWLIVNEDRHMTTRLLLRGYSVRYISHPQAITATETPVTLRRWFLQQVRWARAVHIEALVHPKVYLSQPPIFYYAALRREVTSWFIFATIVSYFFTGVSPYQQFVLRDYINKCLFTMIYLKTRNPINPTWTEWLYSAPATVFYMLPLPAIQAWSFFTMFANDWGTSMRGEMETEWKKSWRALRKKIWEVGFFVVWMGIMGGCVGRYVSAELGYDEWRTMLCMGFGTTSMLVIWGFWLVTIPE